AKSSNNRPGGERGEDRCRDARAITNRRAGSPVEERERTEVANRDNDVQRELHPCTPRKKEDEEAQARENHVQNRDERIGPKFDTVSSQESPDGDEESASACGGAQAGF